MIIADIAVVPLRPYKGEEEMYKVVDACIEIIQNSGLNYEIGAMSTTVEGEFDEVFEIIKKAHKLPFELGCERVITTVRIDEKFGGLTINDKFKDSLYPILTFLAIIIVWQAVVEIKDIPQYILPTPIDIIKVFITDYQNLFDNTLVTLYETILGFILALLVALTLGIIMDFVSVIRKCLYPILVVSQTIPTITIAPLLIIWFGFEALPKILMVALTCFFPILISFVDGLENIDKDYLNLFKTMKSSKLQTFIHLKLPMSIDKLFSGIKISVTYMVVAATVAEWLGGTKGLGVYMVRAKSAYALDKVFASTIIVVVLSLIFVGLVNIAKKIIIKHK